MAAITVRELPNIQAILPNAGSPTESRYTLYFTRELIDTAGTPEDPTDDEYVVRKIYE